MLTNHHQEHASSRHESRKNSIIYKFLTKETHFGLHMTYKHTQKSIKSLETLIPKLYLEINKGFWKIDVMIVEKETNLTKIKPNED